MAIGHTAVEAVTHVAKDVPQLHATRGVVAVMFSSIAPAMVALAILIGSFLVGWALQEIWVLIFYGCDWRHRLPRKKSANAIVFIGIMIKLITIAVGLLIIWQILDLSLGFALSLGIVPLMLSYIAQPVLAPALATVFLLMNNWFKRGDIVSIDGVHRGEVTVIGMFATELAAVSEVAPTKQQGQGETGDSPGFVISPTRVHIIPNTRWFVLPFTVDRIPEPLVPGGTRKNNKEWV